MYHLNVICCICQVAKGFFLFDVKTWARLFLDRLYRLDSMTGDWCWCLHKTTPVKWTPGYYWSRWALQRFFVHVAGASVIRHSPAVRNKAT